MFVTFMTDKGVLKVILLKVKTNLFLPWNYQGCQVWSSLGRLR